MTDEAERSGRTRPRIVVGVDGSAGAARALEWAAAQAARTDAVLEIICCWLYPATLAPFGLPPAAADYREVTRRITDEAVARVADLEPDVAVETRIVEKAPALALVDASTGADLLVVGSRGLGGFKTLLLGSVSQHCTAHARCPVLVVRSPLAHDDAGENEAT